MQNLSSVKNAVKRLNCREIRGETKNRKKGIEQDAAVVLKDDEFLFNS